MAPQKALTDDPRAKPAGEGPPIIDLTQDLKDLVALAGREDGIDDLLRRGLDWLARIAPYDLATVFRVREGDGTLWVQAARGPLADERILRHELSLATFPTVREAMETRRARAFTEHDHVAGDGDPFDGVLDLPPGHACMVVPLCAGTEVLGAMTLDRSRCETYSRQAVDLVEVYGQILALALDNAEKRVRLGRIRARDRQRAQLLEAEISAGPHIVAQSESAAMREVFWRAAQVAATATPVLILGETGTGKERLARAIHAMSPRREGPFVKLNCAAIPAALLESELFGHQKGAFTGADRDRAGRFQLANGGTLLLDEIGEMPLDLQAKLLRVLQEGTFEPVGSDHTVKVDVRILAATHVDLTRAMAERRFREDLYYRLSVFPVTMPPLRERLGDLPALCRALLEEQAQRTGRSGCHVTAAGIEALCAYPWPGNVRELANILERATILSPVPALGPELFEITQPPGAPIPPLAPAAKTAELITLDDLARRHIRAVLDHAGGRIYGAGGAAEILGIHPSTLQSRMKKLGIPRIA